MVAPPPILNPNPSAKPIFPTHGYRPVSALNLCNLKHLPNFSRLFHKLYFLQRRSVETWYKGTRSMITLISSIPTIKQ